MPIFVSCILTAIAGLLSVPVIVFLVEVLASLPSLKERPFEAAERETHKRSQKHVAVIVPAHNESAGILPTIEDIKPQLLAGDRLLVVADNCSDDTALVAAATGAEVTARNDLKQFGKGYALDWGMRHLSTNPPDFVIFIDADCRIQSDMIERLRNACDELQRPIQACFLMLAPTDSSIDYHVAEFAWTVKNWVRPLGLRHLNGPVQLMGTGMIFPWDTIRSVSIASGNLVEDLKLGLDLAAIGKAPRFYPFVVGTSYFPTTVKGAESQRQRWERGHILLILKEAPRMLLRAITRFNYELFVLTLDLMVPPLSLLGTLLIAIYVLASSAALLGWSSAAMAVSGANLLAYMLAAFLAWLKFGRDILPARSITSIGSYVLAKSRLYGRILSGKTAAQWIRTDRSK